MRDEADTVSAGGPTVFHGRIVETFPASKARCPACGAQLFRYTHGKRGGDTLTTCPAKVRDRDNYRINRNCSQKAYILNDGHGWVAVVAVSNEEWGQLVDLDTGEVSDDAIVRLGLHRAAHAALGAVEDEVA